MSDDRLLRIPLPQQFSFAECTWFLNRNYDDCMHTISDTEIKKAIVVNNATFLLRITEQNNHLEIEILQGDTSARSKNAITAYITEWFDLGRDIEPFYKLLRKNKSLAYMCDDFNGLRLLSIPDLFEALCWSVIGQQINLTFAYKLKRRLVARYGTKLFFEEQDYHIFPAHEILAAANKEDLMAMQFSEKKTEYIIGIAKAFSAGVLNKEVIAALPDISAKQKALTDMKGIGTWTANYVLMKTMRVQESIPHGDIGLLQALQQHKIIKERTETDKIDRFFKKYKGWESYLVFYFWRSLAVRNG